MALLHWKSVPEFSQFSEFGGLKDLRACNNGSFTSCCGFSTVTGSSQVHLVTCTSMLTGKNLFFSLLGVWCFSELFFVKEPQDVTVSRKDPVVLDCQARGEAPITITWLKNGGKVSENERIYTLSNGSLYISEVEGKKGELSDEGFYQCLALNKYGAILSQKSHLTLASKFLLLFINLLLSL